MNETWLSVGGTPSVKVVLKDIQPYRGVGMTRLLFTFDVATKQQPVVGFPLWLSGRVELLRAPTHTSLHLASFPPPVQPLVLPQFGADHTLQLSLDISERQLQLIEENRTGGIRLCAILSGYIIQDGQYVTITDSQIIHEIGQSDWITLLEQVGYRRHLLLELEPPDPQAHPELAEAIDFYVRVQRRYVEGEWRLTVESLRQSLAALVGKKADDEEQEEDVEGAAKAIRNQAWVARVGYEPRLELIRQATKFMCDLGAHPEIAETRRHHAYAALLMVGGLLHAFTRA